MQIGFVYLVFDLKTQQYQKERYETLEPAQAEADRLNVGCEPPRYIVQPLSTF